MSVGRSVSRTLRMTFASAILPTAEWDCGSRHACHVCAIVILCIDICALNLGVGLVLVTSRCWRWWGSIDHMLVLWSDALRYVLISVLMSVVLVDVHEGDTFTQRALRGVLILTIEDHVTTPFAWSPQCTVYAKDFLGAFGCGHLRTGVAHFCRREQRQHTFMLYHSWSPADPGSCLRRFCLSSSL